MFDSDAAQEATETESEDEQDGVSESYSIGGEDGQESTQDFELSDALENLK